MSIMSFYALGEAFAALEAELVATGGEWTPEVETAFGLLGELEADKLDAYASVIRNAEASAVAFGGERDAWAAKAHAAKATAERLKARLLEYLQARELPELRGHLWRAAVTANGGKQPLEVLVPVEQLPDELVVTERRPNLEAIRAGAEMGPHGTLWAADTDRPVFAVARLLPRGAHLRIR